MADVAFDPSTGRIDFAVAFAQGARFACSHCEARNQPVHDTQECEGRRLNFFQFEANIHVKAPRVRFIERLREIFRSAPSRERAEPLLKQWYSWARRCHLEPVKQGDKTLKDHWVGILNAFDSKFTNRRFEGANSLIQAAKAKPAGMAPSST